MHSSFTNRRKLVHFFLFFVQGLRNSVSNLSVIQVNGKISIKFRRVRISFFVQCFLTQENTDCSQGEI